MLTKWSLIIQEITFYTQRVINIVIFTLLMLVVTLTILSRLPVFGLKALNVYSGSMKPAILPGDIILVKKVPLWQIGSREVIAFKDPNGSNRIITHRIAAYRYENNQLVFFTQGDANSMIDDWKVSKAAIIGKMFLRIPKLGYLIDLVKKPQGYLLFILLPGLYILLHEGINLSRYLKRLEERESYPDYVSEAKIFN